MKTSIKILATTSLAAALAVAGAAFAHQDMGTGMGPGMKNHGAGPGMGMGMQHGSMNQGGMRGYDRSADAATRLGEWKAALKITPEQESAWAAYSAVVARQVEARNNLRDKMQTQMHGPAAAPTQDHAAVRDTMQKFQQQMQTERSAALKGLYAALTPEQQALADRQMGGMGGGRMAGHMGGGMAGQAPHDHGAGPQRGR